MNPVQARVIERVAEDQTLVLTATDRLRLRACLAGMCEVIPDGDDMSDAIRRRHLLEDLIRENEQLYGKLSVEIAALPSAIMQDLWDSLDTES